MLVLVHTHTGGLFLTGINCHPNGHTQHIKWSEFIPFLSYFYMKIFLKFLHLNILLHELIIYYLTSKMQDNIFQKKISGDRPLKHVQIY